MPSRLAILFRFTAAVLALTFALTAMPAQAEDPFSAVTLEPGETVRVLTLEQWYAVRHFAPERQGIMARIAWCESKFDADAVGDGGRSLGAWQVQPQFWGEVPATLEEQAQQAERIAAEHGTDPWTTRDGCEGWNR
jgi:hypothetical protein